MLEYAKKYEEQLRQLFFDTAFDPFYKFELTSPYRDVFELPKDTWNSHHFVSIHNEKLLGMIGYQIRRAENAVDSLHIIHFGGHGGMTDSYIFGKDTMTAIKDIFEQYRFRKLNFGVVVGNPIEGTYDKLVKRYHGRIVGIWEQHVKLLDGKLYDLKEYEITAERYVKSKRWTV